MTPQTLADAVYQAALRQMRPELPRTPDRGFYIGDTWVMVSQPNAPLVFPPSASQPPQTGR